LGIALVGDIQDAKKHVGLTVRPENHGVLNAKWPRYPCIYRESEEDTYDVKDRREMPEVAHGSYLNRAAQMKLALENDELYHYMDIVLPYGWTVDPKYERVECPTNAVGLGEVKVYDKEVKVNNVYAVVVFRLTFEGSALNMNSLISKTKGWNIKSDK
jgi:hypothetical protein